MAELAIIVLAAGQGTRMKSDLHKVLHPIAGRPMLLHLLDSARPLNPSRTVVVVGSKAEQVEAVVAPLGAAVARQEPQRGTGHAALQAQAALAGFDGIVLVMFGDTPFITTGTMQAMIARLEADDAPAVVVLAFTPNDPGAYGRIATDEGGRIIKMVEYKDASPEERAIRLCNSGLMAVRAHDLFALLAQVGNDNAAGEYYLVDIVNIAAAQSRASVVHEGAAWEVAGVNSRAELAALEADWQARKRAAIMAAGATLIAPETVWFAYDTAIGRDVTIGQNVIFGPGVTVADTARIHAFSHIEGATIAPGAEVGPYARLRPGAVLADKAKVGNFVEVKNAVLGKGAKANHLSYIGDAEVGAGANIGAGTITCNYDGYFKHKTVIGEDAFIGSNSALVAPVTIGAQAIVGAGATVTRDVDPGALALVRPEQVAKPGWAKRFHAIMRAKKAS